MNPLQCRAQVAGGGVGPPGWNTPRLPPPRHDQLRGRRDRCGCPRRGRRPQAEAAITDRKAEAMTRAATLVIYENR